MEVDWNDTWQQGFDNAIGVGHGKTWLVDLKSVCVLCQAAELVIGDWRLGKKNLDPFLWQHLGWKPSKFSWQLTKVLSFLITVKHLRQTGRIWRPVFWALWWRREIGALLTATMCELSSGHFTALWAETGPPPAHTVKARCRRTDSDAHAGMIMNTGRHAQTQTHVSAPLITDHSLMRCVTSLRGVEPTMHMCVCEWESVG